MSIFQSAVISIAVVSATPTAPEVSATARYSELKEVAVNDCLKRFLNADLKSTTSMVQNSVSLGELCGCIGDLLATSFFPLAMPDLRKLEEPDSVEMRNKIGELSASLSPLCFNKLTPKPD